jgi:hypothetical protein
MRPAALSKSLVLLDRYLVLMPSELAGFFVDELIIHEVPQRVPGGGPGPTLSDVPSTLTDDLRGYFREKILQSLDQSVRVVRDPTISTPVPDEMLAQFEADSSMVSPSQTMARHLYSAQTRVNPAGLLILIRGTLDAQPVAVVLKLEKEGAVRVRRQHVPGGQTYQITHLDDLTLHNRTRVFKTGFFPRFERVVRMRGYVADEQRGYSAPHDVAAFFLSTFLGCRLAEDPQVVTRRFFEATQRFINERVGPPDAKAAYELALMAEMQSQAAQFDPRRFATRHMSGADARRFLDFLEGADVELRVFDKDTKQIDGRIKQMAIEMVSGIRVSGPRDEWERSVDVAEHRDGGARVTVDGQIKRLGR